MRLKTWILPAALVLAALMFAWCLGGQGAGPVSALPEESASPAEPPAPGAGESEQAPPEETPSLPEEEEPSADGEETSGSPAVNSPLPEPAQREPEESEEAPAETVCTLTIRCDTILNHLDQLDAGKRDLVPEKGVLYEEQTVSFTQGESVFDLLQRETRSAGLHLEFVNTPVYGSAYIEGIGNLYEFDCGSLSGWVYSVNGEFPNYGCSGYTLREGDAVVWQYTCDLGEDVGGSNGAWS